MYCKFQIMHSDACSMYKSNVFTVGNMYVNAYNMCSEIYNINIPKIWTLRCSILNALINANIRIRRQCQVFNFERFN